MTSRLLDKDPLGEDHVDLVSQSLKGPGSGGVKYIPNANAKRSSQS